MRARCVSILRRTPVSYTHLNLEIARTTADKDLGAVVSELDAFEKYVTQFGVKTLNERNNSPQEYCRLYRERYLPAENSNLALGARIVWIAAQMCIRDRCVPTACCPWFPST